MTSNVFEEMDYREGFAGGCYFNGTAICVAKPENYCDDETFVPAHYLRSNSGHPLRYCAGRLEDVIIGRCGGINGKCSNLQSRCNSDNNSSNGNNEGIIGNNSTSAEEEEDQNSSSSFIEYDPTCTITQDLSSASSSLTSLLYVTYGKCGDRCVWSSDDCINDEIYIPNGNNTECTADKVQIGACFGGHAFCAVDSSSCTQPNRPDEPYWTHQEVQEKIGANCFLSSLPVPTPAPVVSAPAPAPAPAQSPSTVTNTTTTTTNTAVGGEKNLLSSSGNNNNNDGLNTGALVAIVTVIAIVVGIAIGVIGTVRFSSKRKNSNNSSNNTEQPPPTIPIEDIEIMSSPNNHNNNNNPMDDVDAHSELSEDNNDIIMN